MPVAFTYTDVDPYFVANPLSGDVGVAYDVQAIINSCKNLIFTKMLARPFQPTVASGIDNELFELANVVTAQNIQLKCENVIKSYEPRVETVTVDVAINGSQNGYDVTITILPKNSLTQSAFTISLLTRAI